MAIPALQLDISPGIYDSETETTIATIPNPTLTALADPGAKGFNIREWYYISAAIAPQVGPSSTATPSVDFGSFKIDGVEYFFGNPDPKYNLVYGTPPIESNLAFDSGDLSKHSIFPTYFAQVAFQFDSSVGNRVAAYNVEDGTGGTGYLYKKDFSIDVSGLAVGYSVHFDLYSEEFSKGCDIDVNKFAPFSHDAQSLEVSHVPDGSATLGLLGLGLMGLGFYRVLSRRKG